MIHPRHDNELISKFLEGVCIKSSAIKEDQRTLHEHLFVRDVDIAQLSSILNDMGNAATLLRSAIAKTRAALRMDDEEGQ